MAVAICLGVHLVAAPCGRAPPTGAGPRGVVEHQAAPWAGAASQTGGVDRQQVDRVSSDECKRRRHHLAARRIDMAGAVGAQHRMRGGVRGAAVHDGDVRRRERVAVDHLADQPMDGLAQRVRCCEMARRRPSRCRQARCNEPAAQVVRGREQLGGPHGAIPQCPGEVDRRPTPEGELGSGRVHESTTSNAWISSTMFAGSDETPTASRVWRPASPNTSTSTSDAASITPVC